MENRFTKSAEEALGATLEAAKELRHGYIGSEHLLIGLLSKQQGAAARILMGKGIDKDRIYELLQTRETKGTKGTKEVEATDMTPRTKRIIERCAQVANRFGQGYIGTEHILYSLLEESECVAVKLLVSCGVYINDLLEELTAFFASEDEDGKKDRESGRNLQSRIGMKAQTLSKYGTDLTAAARLGKIDPIIGRDEETARVIQILTRRTKNNPCLIGEPGVGKTAVVEGLAKRIAENDVPLLLRGKTLFRLDLSSMIAGAKYRGEFEERMKSVVEEIQKCANIILFIDEIHTIVGAGAAEGAVDAANIMKPALARADLQVIGATTFREYRKYIEKDAALERRFQSVTVLEPSQEDTVLILQGLRDKFESHHQLKISDGAIRAAVSMSVKYIPDRYLPDKAIDLIDEAASKKRIEAYVAPERVKELEKRLQEITLEKEAAIKNQSFENAAYYRDRQAQLKGELAQARAAWEEERSNIMLSIGEDEIAQIVTSWTGVPANRLAESEADRLLRMEAELHCRVIGQEEAVKTVADTIKRAGAGLSDPTRPMGSFLFLGPTGVGKTELAKAVAESMFGSENAMIRLDMSEYMEKQSISKLIGSAPGYVGYDEGGQLTEKVRRRPYSLILFDEIEKAHPDLFNSLLQILDEGRLTDSKGRSVDFKNTVIIMTSNVGANAYSKVKPLGFKTDSAMADTKEKILQSLRQTFSAEFLNRIDETVIFDQLCIEDVKKIAALMLARLRGRLRERGIELSFDDAVLDHLAKKGYDPLYGARPLRRVIRRYVEDAVSLRILKGELKNGDNAVCTVEQGNIVIVGKD